MAELGRNPARIIPEVIAFAQSHRGQDVCCVAEPVWPGRTAEEMVEAVRHEALGYRDALRSGRSFIASRAEQAGLASPRISDLWSSPWVSSPPTPVRHAGGDGTVQIWHRRLDWSTSSAISSRPEPAGRAPLPACTCAWANPQDSCRRRRGSRRRRVIDVTGRLRSARCLHPVIGYLVRRVRSFFVLELRAD
jgi:hypothetical protein